MAASRISILFEVFNLNIFISGSKICGISGVNITNNDDLRGMCCIGRTLSPPDPDIPTVRADVAGGRRVESKLRQHPDRDKQRQESSVATRPLRRFDLFRGEQSCLVRCAVLLFANWICILSTGPAHLSVLRHPSMP